MHKSEIKMDQRLSTTHTYQKTNKKIHTQTNNKTDEPIARLTKKKEGSLLLIPQTLKRPQKEHYGWVW